jgi:hypothetical protein
MKLKIEQWYRGYTPGTITDALPDGVANELIRRKIASEVKAEVKDKKVRKPSSNKMMKSPEEQENKDTQ